MKTAKKSINGFSDEERAAMLERANELAKSEKNGENAVLEAIAKMPKADSTIAKRLHTLIKQMAPSLSPKTWYGFPAYADKNGKVVCFFQYAGKFKTRYATLGFSDQAKLDDGQMWPVTFAVMKLTPVEEKRIAALVKKAVG